MALAHRAERRDNQTLKYMLCEMKDSVLIYGTDKFRTTFKEKHRRTKNATCEPFRKRTLERNNRFAFYNLDETREAIENQHLSPPPQEQRSKQLVAVVSAQHSIDPMEADVKYKIICPRKCGTKGVNAAIQSAFTDILRLFDRMERIELPVQQAPLKEVQQLLLQQQVQLLHRLQQVPEVPEVQQLPKVQEPSQVQELPQVQQPHRDRFPLARLNGNRQVTPLDLLAQAAQPLPSQPSPSYASERNGECSSRPSSLVGKHAHPFAVGSASSVRSRHGRNDDADIETLEGASGRLEDAAHLITQHLDGVFKTFTELQKELDIPNSVGTVSLDVRDDQLTDALFKECTDLMHTENEPVPADAHSWQRKYTTPSPRTEPSRILYLRKKGKQVGKMMAFIIYLPELDYHPFPYCVCISDLYVSQWYRKPPGLASGPKIGACLVLSAVRIAAASDAAMIYAMVFTHNLWIREWWSKQGFQKILAREFLNGSHKQTGLEGRFMILDKQSKKMVSRLPHLGFGISESLDPNRKVGGRPPPPPLAFNPAQPPAHCRRNCRV